MCTRSYAPKDSTICLIKNNETNSVGFPSDVDRFDIIRPETGGTCWTLPVTHFNNSLYTGVAEQVVALCNHNLKEEKEKRNSQD